MFTKLDMLKGYHQCPLDEESQLLTTFITLFGQLKYLRAPYGISSMSEYYNCRMNEAFAGLTGYRRIVNNVIHYMTVTQQYILTTFGSFLTEQKITLSLSSPKGRSTLQDSHCWHKVTLSMTLLPKYHSFPHPSEPHRSSCFFFGLANQ